MAIDHHIVAAIRHLNQILNYPIKQLYIDFIKFYHLAGLIQKQINFHCTL